MKSSCKARMPKSKLRSAVGLAMALSSAVRGARTSPCRESPIRNPNLAERAKGSERIDQQGVQHGLKRSYQPPAADTAPSAEDGSKRPCVKWQRWRFAVFTLKGWEITAQGRGSA